MMSAVKSLQAVFFDMQVTAYQAAVQHIQCGLSCTVHLGDWGHVFIPAAMACNHTCRNGM